MQYIQRKLTQLYFRRGSNTVIKLPYTEAPVMNQPQQVHQNTQLFSPFLVQSAYWIGPIFADHERAHTTVQHSTAAASIRLPGAQNCGCFEHVTCWALWSKQQTLLKIL